MDDGVQAVVTGIVRRVVDGRFSMEVRDPRSKAQYPDWVTVWRPDFQVQDGDHISVSGRLSWARNERPDGRVFLNVSLNAPVLSNAPATTTAIEDNPAGWYDDTQTPF